MPVADQDQIAASLRRQIYDGDVEAVTSELEERVRRAWQEHGYFHVKVRGKVTKLASSPAKSRIAASFELDEGPQFRLAGITFKGDTAVIDPGSLRSLFPMEDGDVFDTTQVAKGLEELSQAYGQLGYINSTAIPETQISDEHRTISLNVDIDEGKQFLVSNIRVVGLDEDASQNLLTGFLLKAGDAYNQKLLELSMERLAVPQSAMSYELQRNERAGTVAVSIRFVRCP